METLTGLPIMSIPVTIGTTHIKYEMSQSVDILNQTESDIYVNTENEFDRGTHFIIPAGAAYNNFRIGALSADLYIKSISAGVICVVCTRY